jgi:hypothetical protein
VYERDTIPEHIIRRASAGMITASTFLTHGIFCHHVAGAWIAHKINQLPDGNPIFRILAPCALETMNSQARAMNSLLKRNTFDDTAFGPTYEGLVFARQHYSKGFAPDGSLDRAAILKAYGVRRILKELETKDQPTPSPVRALSVWHAHIAKFATDAVECMYPTEECFDADTTTKEWLVSTGLGSTREDLIHLIENGFSAQIRHNLMSNEYMALYFNTYPPYARTDNMMAYNYEQQFRMVQVLKATSMSWVPISQDMSSLLHTARYRDDQTRDRLVGLVSSFYQGTHNLDLGYAHRVFQPSEIACSIGL